MTDIKFLLDKYEKQNNNKWVKGESTSNEYRKKQRLEANRKHRHLILDGLLNEIGFTLTHNEIAQIRYWIDTFNPHWKEFHRQSKNETIILAMIMIQYKTRNTQLRINKFSISKKYNLTSSKFELIQNRLIFLLMKYTPLTYAQSNKYDNYILNKNGY